MARPVSRETPVRKAPSFFEVSLLLWDEAISYVIMSGSCSTTNCGPDTVSYGSRGTERNEDVYVYVHAAIQDHTYAIMIMLQCFMSV